MNLTIGLNLESLWWEIGALPIRCKCDLPCCTASQSFSSSLQPHHLPNASRIAYWSSRLNATTTFPYSCHLFQYVCLHIFHVHTLMTHLPHSNSVSQFTHYSEQSNNKPFNGWIELERVTSKSDIFPSKLDGKILPSRSEI